MKKENILNHDLFPLNLVILIHQDPRDSIIMDVIIFFINTDRGKIGPG